MAVSGLTQFDAAIHKTNEWLRDLMTELDWEDKHAAYFALRTVLHVLRNRLTIQEAVDLGAQLPMLVRGFYYEGWTPSAVRSRDRTAEQFLAHIREAYADNEWVDVEHVTRAVFRVLARHVSSGEVDDVLRCLPEDIRRLWD